MNDQPLVPPPERWSESPAYLMGIELFNDRQYWESHEAWEEIWLHCDGVQSEFLQGLIQCAAALLKFQRNEPAPAKRLYATGMGRLILCPEHYMGLDVRGFQRDMEACFQPILTGPYRQLDEGKLPRIEVKAQE